MKTRLAILPLILTTNVAFSIAILDDFSDGILNPALWTTFTRDGTAVEKAGSLQFTLNTPVSGSSYAGLRLQESISSNSDFRITADIAYRYTEVQSLIFGIVVYSPNSSNERFAAGFTTNSSNTMGVSAYGPTEPTYSFKSGAPIADETFTFQIDYMASESLFNFMVIVSDSVVGSISHSISSDPTADLSYDWNLADGSLLGLEIVAETFSGSVPEGMIKLDHIEIVSVPEVQHFTFILASLVLVSLALFRKLNV